MEKQTKYDVFISYSTVDKLIAEGVCGYLESHRIRCFVAYRDIPKSEDWAKAIPPALRESKLMLAVFSKAFNMSDQTDNELHIAEKRKIPVLTFRLTDDDFDGAKEYFLTKSNWIDAFPEPEKQFGELLKSVALLLNKKDIITPSEEIVNTIQKHDSSTSSICEDAKRLLYADKDHREPLKAVYMLRKAVKENDPEAEYQLGRCYYYGIGVAQSWSHAQEWWTKASEHGHLKAKYGLGRMFHYAIGCKQNIMQALSLYTEAAEGGCGEAAKMLGKVYHTGELGVQAEERSLEWYDRALELLQEAIFERDDVSAMRTLAYSYMDGEGVERDYSLTVEWLSRAAKLNDADAMNGLYICYDEGIGVPKNEEKAQYWLSLGADLDSRHAQNSLSTKLEEKGQIENCRYYRLKAANGGNGMAQSNIAFEYQNGGAVFDENMQQAEYWYKKAIEGGSLQAMCNYAITLENKENRTDEELTQAITYYKRAAMLDYVPAYITLGNCYYHGLGLEESDKEAERWYKKFVEIYENMLAEGVEKQWYSNGQGSHASMTFAEEYWQNILIQACENLAWIYRKSKTVEHDETEADRLEGIINKIKESRGEIVISSEAEALCEKGDDYYYGRNGVSQDYAEAVKYYLQAA